MKQILSDLLGPQAKTKTVEYLQRETARWEETRRELVRILPNVTPQPEDLLWNLPEIDLVRECLARCKRCDTSRWKRDKDRTDHDLPEEIPCALPLTPAVTRGQRACADPAVKRLDVVWSSCSLYRAWAKGHGGSDDHETRPRGRTRTYRNHVRGQ